jgi:hypothetical protein
MIIHSELERMGEECVQGLYVKELTQYSLEMTHEKHHSIITNFISNTESDS